MFNQILIIVCKLLNKLVTISQLAVFNVPIIILQIPPFKLSVCINECLEINLDCSKFLFQKNDDQP